MNSVVNNSKPVTQIAKVHEEGVQVPGLECIRSSYNSFPGWTFLGYFLPQM